VLRTYAYDALSARLACTSNTTEGTDTIRERPQTTSRRQIFCVIALHFGDDSSEYDMVLWAQLI
jgi:hypothetical protein